MKKGNNVIQKDRKLLVKRAQYGFHTRKESSLRLVRGIFSKIGFSNIVVAVKVITGFSKKP